MRVADIEDTQGYTPLVLFMDCWYGYKEIDDEEYDFNVAIIDNEGDIIKMKLQNTKEIPDAWFSFATAYRIPEKTKVAKRPKLFQE